MSSINISSVVHSVVKLFCCSQSFLYFGFMLKSVCSLLTEIDCKRCRQHITNYIRISLGRLMILSIVHSNKPTHQLSCLQTNYPCQTLIIKPGPPLIFINNSFSQANSVPLKLFSQYIYEEYFESEKTKRMFDIPKMFLFFKMTLNVLS